MARDSSETRRRLIAAADGLFYGQGIRAVGVDAIAEAAGVTKRTLYYHFASKDDLIAAYLEERDLPTLGRYQRMIPEGAAPAEHRIRRIFERLGKNAEDPHWRGCSFLRASGRVRKSARPSGPRGRFASQEALRGLVGRSSRR